MTFKTVYGEFENKRKFYLGLSDSQGIDSDFFDYKGKNLSGDAWTGLTSGFHMDIDASGVTIDDVVMPLGTGGTYNPIFTFQTGDAEFRTDAGLVGTPYEKIFARKFTFAPYGGFDGWDIYRTRRSNLDRYKQYFAKYNKTGFNIIFQEEPEGYFSNRWLTCILVDAALNNGLTREVIRLSLEEENIESRPLWKPMHQQPIFADCKSYLNGVSDKLFEDGLCLPSGSNLIEEEFDRINKELLRLKSHISGDQLKVIREVKAKFKS